MYYGTQRPIIKYGTSYGSTWNLETDDVNVSYYPQWAKARILNESPITGYIQSVDKATSSDDYGRLSLKMIFHNLTTAQFETLRELRDEKTLKITLHADNASYDDPMEFVFVVTKFLVFASGESGTPYPLYDSAVIECRTQEYVNLYDDDIIP